ncbi:tripartite tricarboxylate transporter TctB family protein [Oceaniglobus trochenteri]|uniref:tripartite tricarboxylate transporter TctB family protein n=1 Tax=Oceaniglobus trochenteri TaxID=2763260 RepID=UPI001CFFCA91|nr:tripartite tricarboxylate transporter TctB family protein [Oceaniglobus trochenteri]
MAERLFYGALFILTLGYLYFAFVTIKAPIQYDPLGPETWPRLLGLLMAVALAIRLVRPSGVAPDVARKTIIRLAVVAGFLLLYAILFQRLGFILSTWGFCSAVTWLLGTRPVKAVIFGAVVSTVTFFVFTDLLDLNLPGGLLEFLD